MTIKKYAVQMVIEAEQDLLHIYEYVAIHDSPRKADGLLDKIEALCLSLEQLPERGYLPPELERFGIYIYREVHFKPYRVIYQIIENTVYIHCVLDGRRDLDQLLLHRLLR